MGRMGRIDWKPWIEKVLREMYTIGGTILFPKHPNNINGQRGMNPFICDRWDLTLECIRRYYEGITDKDHNPLGWVLETDKPFFDMFVDFRGYYDFFFLQDPFLKNIILSGCGFHQGSSKRNIPTPKQLMSTLAG